MNKIIKHSSWLYLRVYQPELHFRTEEARQWARGPYENCIPLGNSMSLNQNQTPNFNRCLLFLGGSTWLAFSALLSEFITQMGGKSWARMPQWSSFQNLILETSNSTITIILLVNFTEWQVYLNTFQKLLSQYAFPHSFFPLLMCQKQIHFLFISRLLSVMKSMHGT